MVDRLVHWLKRKNGLRSTMGEPGNKCANVEPSPSRRIL